MFQTDKYLNALSKVDRDSLYMYSETIDLLDQCISFVEDLKLEKKNPLEQYKLNYKINKAIFDVKHFAILIRDIFLEQFKSGQLLKDHFISEEQFDAQKTKIQALFNEAFASLNKKEGYISNLEQIDNRLDFKWSHHLSPISEIAEQLQEIKSQIEFIKSADEQMDQVRADLTIYEKWLKEIYSNFENSLNLVKSRLASIGQQISEISEDSVEELKPLISTLRKYYSELDNENNQYPIEEYKIDTIAHSSIPVSTNDSYIVSKDVPFKQQIIRWEESEVYPLILNVQERLISIYDRSLSGLFNARNRIQLLTGETEEIFDFQADSLKNHIERINVSILEAEEILADSRSKAKDKVNKELPVSNVFSDRKLYLNFSSGLSLSSYKKRRTKWLETMRIQKAWDYVKSKTIQRFRVPQIQDNQGKFAKVVKFIDQKSYTDMDRLSQSLFFGKGHMGNTFMMERKSYERSLKETVDQWKSGYRGSLLIFGKRLSGRSALAEFTGYSNYFNRVIHLTPNKEIKYKGRIIDGSYDLGSILKELDYHSISDHLCIVIDDLELWRNKHYSWFDNVQSLVNMINKSGRRLFFIITCGRYAKRHLDQYFSFSDQFMSLYCTDRMDKEEIKDAILIRYGASQASDEHISQAELTKRINRIIKINHQNIGVCLMEWYRLLYQDEKHKERENKVQLQSFKLFVKENSYLIRYLLKLKLVTEIEIKADVGNENFKMVNRDVQMLLGCKVLERLHNSRELRINEHIVDEIEIELLSIDN